MTVRIEADAPSNALYMLGSLSISRHPDKLFSNINPMTDDLDERK